MIEIVFDDSALGSLKMAKRQGGGRRGLTVSVAILAETEALAEPKAPGQPRHQKRMMEQNAVPLEGDPADAFAFSLAHSVGPIGQDGIGEERLAALQRLFSCCPAMWAAMRPARYTGRRWKIWRP